MSEDSRRLSYRKRKKLGLSFSEAFLAEAGPHKARSVDRGYATVMSPSSVNQGDEQSEWDERHARVDQQDGLSKLMADVSDATDGDDASEEIFVGEGNMKEAMFSAFTDELSKLAGNTSEATLGDTVMVAFIDELVEQGCLGDEEIDKLAGAMDMQRRRMALSRGARVTRSERAYGKGRLRGDVKVKRSQEAKAARGGTGEELLSAQKASGKAERRLKSGSSLNPKSWLRDRRHAANAARTGAREGMAKTKRDVTAGGDIQSEKAYRQRAAQGAVPAQAPGQVPGQAPVPAPAPAPEMVPAGAEAAPGWLGQRWNALTNPVAAAYQGGGLGAVPGGVWQGMKASPLLGGLGAGLAGMAIVPPAMRAMGLQNEQSPGAIPGMVNVPGY